MGLMADWTILQWVALVERELLLFAGIFFIIGALDELLVDGIWGWMKLTGRIPRLQLNRGDIRARHLTGAAAVFIPAWHEDKVIQHTIAHALASWPHQDFVIYVGVYRNDMATLEAAMRADPGGAAAAGRITLDRQPLLRGIRRSSRQDHGGARLAGHLYACCRCRLRD